MHTMATKRRGQRGKSPSTLRGGGTSTLREKTAKVSTAPSLFAVAWSLLKVVLATIFSLDPDLALTKSGVFLVLFLAIHLGGNISIFAGDRGGKFNAYGYFLRESPIIVGIELYLLFALLCHVLVAMWITLREGKCTLASTLKSGYKNTWVKTRLAITGTCILVFLVVHLFDFRFGKEYDAALPLISMKKNPWHRYFGGEEYISRVRDLYRIQKETMSDPKHVVFYIFSCYAIASHLKSGFLRTNVKVVPKEHRKLAAWIIPPCFDIMMGTFALIPIATYFDYV